MKKFLFLFICLMFVLQLPAQSDGFRYQTVIFINGTPYANQTVDLMLSIKDAYNNIEYSENHTVTTDSQGRVDVIVGNGTLLQGDFNNIDWTLGDYYLDVSVSYDGGLFYEPYGYTELKFVPYTKYTVKGGSMQELNNFPEVDVDYANGTLFILSDNTQNSGEFNTAVGQNALKNNTTGEKNTAFGYGALTNNTTGNENTAFGYQAMLFNRTGNQNTVAGISALLSSINTSFNTVAGDFALNQLNTGDYNTVIGSEAMEQTTKASYNTVLGFQTGQNVDSVHHNVFVSGDSYSNVSYSTVVGGAFSSGNNNTMIGYFIGFDNTENNTVIGFQANNRVYGLNNTSIGYRSGKISTYGVTYNNVTFLNSDEDPGGDNRVIIGNSSVTSIGGHANWTNVSDGRFKTGISNALPGLELIRKLRPVTYRLDFDAFRKFRQTSDSIYDRVSYKKKAQELQIGFIAQEVERAANELDFDFHAVDKPENPETGRYGLRYAEFVPVLVKALQQLQQTNRRLRDKHNEQLQTIRRLEKAVQVLEQQIELLEQQDAESISGNPSNN